MTWLTCKAVRLLRSESGAALVEWMVVTLILILATYALFQAVGAQLDVLGSDALKWIRSIVPRW